MAIIVSINYSKARERMMKVENDRIKKYNLKQKNKIEQGKRVKKDRRFRPYLNQNTFSDKIFITSYSQGPHLGIVFGIQSIDFLLKQHGLSSLKITNSMTQLQKRILAFKNELLYLKNDCNQGYINVINYSPQKFDTNDFIISIYKRKNANNSSTGNSNEHFYYKFINTETDAEASEQDTALPPKPKRRKLSGNRYC